MNDERSGLFRLDLNDLARGAIVAVAAAVGTAIFGVLHGVFSAPGFDVFTQDWGGVGKEIVNTAVVAMEGAFTGYLFKNFMTNEKGDVVIPKIGTIKLSK